MQQIARAEDIEFTKLKTQTDKVIRNMFVYTADELGVKRFEKILGITPKAGQSIDDRKIYIIFMMNRRKMSLSELTAMLSNYSEGIELINDISNMMMIVSINTDMSNLEMLNNIIDQIIPMNIYFEFSFHISHAVKIKNESAVCFHSFFTPQFNSESHELEGEHELDGSKFLNGYSTERFIDLYPLQITAHNKILQQVIEIARIILHSKVSCMEEIDTNTSCLIQASQQVLGKTETRIQNNYELAGSGLTQVTVEDHLRYLDDNGYLDGNGYLNADIYQQEI